MTTLVQPGDRIGDKYVIERLLGEGGMGAVYVARQEALGRQVAIKMLHAEGLTRDDVRARFEREARAVAALRSDHVARVLDVGHLESGAPYLVMDLLEGEDLAAALERRGPLAPDEVIDAMVQACDALAEAHGLGIVHRDLKPANLFLARRANGGTTVKVLDFGVSKATHETVGLSLTQTASVVGSPLYMSPEQLREARNVDGRADVWALGVTMYELLSGQMPFEAKNFAELCSTILNNAARPLNELCPGLPPELGLAVMRCLEKDPSARFGGAAELAEALSGIRGVSSVRISRPLMTTGPTSLKGTADALARTQQRPAPAGAGKKWAVVGAGVVVAVVGVAALVMGNGGPRTVTAGQGSSTSTPTSTTTSTSTSTPTPTATATTTTTTTSTPTPTPTPTATATPTDPARLEADQAPPAARPTPPSFLGTLPTATAKPASTQAAPHRAPAPPPPGKPPADPLALPML